MRGFEALAGSLMERLGSGAAGASPEWPWFKKRLQKELKPLVESLWQIYSDRPDFAFVLERLAMAALECREDRPSRLRERDDLPRPSMAERVAAVCYVDLFALNFKGVGGRIPYLRELGVTLLHLMPFFASPPDENDGGYAVSDYRSTDPRLGTMADLEELERELDAAGIALMADFVFNHTSDRHEWAERARKGDQRYQNYYHFFDDKESTEPYQRHLRDIFPDARKGSFTREPETGKWVWTTFHSYQWDLDYRNPETLEAMARELLSLANRGISVVRLDAVAFAWKEAGSCCENLEGAHAVIRAFRCLANLAAPSVEFLSEAIVHPDDIARYVSEAECRLSYNPLLMAELWEACATRETKLLARSVEKRSWLPEGCAWLNYVRCHDDIGWTFADEDAAEVGIKGRDHRAFLNAFYSGRFEGSFARGLPFQENPATGDMRISGTAASLCGIEAALKGEIPAEEALSRLRLLYGVVYAFPGIPLLYLGDELAVLNDISYLETGGKAKDSRWAHRVAWSDARAERRSTPGTLEHAAFTTLAAMARARSASGALKRGSLRILDSGNPHALLFSRFTENSYVCVAANFSERDIVVDAPTLPRGGARDLLTGMTLPPGDGVRLGPCGIVWLEY